MSYNKPNKVPKYKIRPEEIYAKKLYFCSAWIQHINPTQKQLSLKWSLLGSVLNYCFTWFQGTDPLSFAIDSYVWKLLLLGWCGFVVVAVFLVVFLVTSRFSLVASSGCLFSLPCWCNLPYMFLSLLLQLTSQWTPWQLALSPTAVSCLPAAFYHFACILVITNRLLRLLFGALVIPCWFYHLFPTDLLLNLYFVLYSVLILDFWLWDSINQIQGTFSRNFQSA